jgi:hypothetical protein
MRLARRAFALGEAVQSVLDLKTVGRVAQVVEQRPFKAWVAGSNPAALTNIKMVSWPSARGPVIFMGSRIRAKSYFDR